VCAVGFPLAHASLNTGEWYASKDHLLAACQHRVHHDNGGGGCDGGGGDDISDDVNGEVLPDEVDTSDSS
jgi:hypothetical protein